MGRNLYVVGNGTWLQDFVSLLNSQITVPHMYVHMRHVELKIVMTTNSHMAFILCLIFKSSIGESLDFSLFKTNFALLALYTFSQYKVSMMTVTQSLVL